VNSTATTAPHSFADFAEILAAVTASTGVPAANLTCSQRSTADVTTARSLVWALLRVTAGLSLAEIGTLYQKDETSIQTSLYRLGDRLPQEPALAARYFALLQGRRIRCHLLNAVHTARLCERLKRRHERPRHEIASDHVGKSTHGTIDQLNEDSLRRQLLDAEEQLAYWKSAKFRTASDKDRAAAGARITVWDMQVSAIERRLRELTRKETLTA
jgi:hypothetical protein